MKRRSAFIGTIVLLVLATLAASPALSLEEPERLWLVGEKAFADGLVPLARRVLERFVVQYPNDPRLPDAVLLLGKARLADGDAAGALDLFRRAQTLAPVPGRPLEARFWEGEALFRQKKFADARTVYDDVVRQNAASPLAPEALYGFAWSELELKRPEAGAEAFRQLLTAWPESEIAPSATYYLARTLVELKRYGEALPLLQAFPTKYAGHKLAPDAQYLTGVARMGNGDATGGVDELRAFVAANPNHPLVPNARRVIADGTVARALDPASRGGDVPARGGEAPRGTETPSRPADTASRPTPPADERPEDAYKRLMAENTAESLNEAATVAARLKRPRDEEAALKKLHASFPSNPLGRRAALELANRAFKRKDWKDAATLATSAARSDDAAIKAEAWLLAGESELKQRRAAPAAKAFEAATTVDGVDAAVRYRALAGLGLAREEQQEWRAALTAYETVASKCPDATLRDWAKQRAAAVRSRVSETPKAGGKPAPKGKS
jgi:TolA-binding protein